MNLQEKYASYAFEDFLQDDFFVESCKNPVAESIDFWRRFLEKHPQQAETYHAARKFLAFVARPQISDEEGAGMWADIQTKHKFFVERLRKKKMTFYAAAVAASIALFLIARVFFDRRDEGPIGNDIMAFVAGQVDSLNNSSGDVQLILSERKTVYLQEKESVITYDSANVSTGYEEISKNDIASYNQLMVPYGKSSVLTLHDGTKVWVNAGTRLVYPVEFDKDKREIYINGEIYLDVTPDAKRPFTVRTNDLQIQVVGTKFNVQAYASDDQSRIALESGSVKIISGNTDDVLLNPNQLYEHDNNGHSTVKDTDIRKYTSWIHHLYMYESERLDVILKRLERHYGINILFDPSVAEIRCTGKLDLKENLEEVLATISMAALVEYIKDGESYIISYQP